MFNRAKCGKAVGADMIPTKDLNNDTACHFLLQLFHKCFEKNFAFNVDEGYY